MCGLWLVPFINPLHSVKQLAERLSSGRMRSKASKPLVPGGQCAEAIKPSVRRDPRAIETTHETLQMSEFLDAQQTIAVARNSSPKPDMPISLYPACILASGMVARGEIGFLIAALAESKSILGGRASDEPSELFLVVTWAISLCTIIGPICVGLLVNRVNRLEKRKGQRQEEGTHNVLGAWGVA